MQDPTRLSSLRSSPFALALLVLASGSTTAAACGGSSGDDTGSGAAGAAGSEIPEGGADTSTDAAPEAAVEGGEESDAKPPHSGIGDPCASDSDCLAIDQSCNTAFPGGYCEQPCDTSTPCPSDSTCTTPFQEGGVSECRVACVTDSDCRTNYHCSTKRHICVPAGGGSSGAGVTPGTNNGAACVTPVVAAPGTGAVFGQDKKVSSAAMAAECQLAADAAHDRVVASWIDIAPNGVSKIGVAISDDGGATFGTPDLLPHDNTVVKGGQQSDPVVTVDPDGSFFVTWIGYDQSGQSTTNMNVYVAKAAAGQAFTEIFQVTPSTEWTSTAGLDKPWIAASPTDGALYQTWARLSNTGSDIRMARSADHGLTWSAPATLTDPAAAERNLAQVTVGADGQAYVTWVQLAGQQFGDTLNGIYLQRLNADGTRNGSNVKVSGAGDSPAFEDPSISVSGTNVYVGFVSGTTKGDWDIHVATSLDSGASFQAAIKANDDATCATHFHHQLAVDGSGRVHVIYYDNRYLTGNVFHQVSPAAAAGTPLAFDAATFVNSAGFTFTTSRAAQNWLGDYLGLAVSGNTMHALWSDPRNGGTSQIYYANATLQ